MTSHPELPTGLGIGRGSRPKAAGGPSAPPLIGEVDAPAVLGSRRRFLAQSLAAAAPLIVKTSSLWGATRPAASNRITLGFVGLGGRGFQNLRAFLAQPAAQVVAVCDVDRAHERERRRKAKLTLGRVPAQKFVDAFYSRGQARSPARGCQAYADFRELCARPDIDAVVISTPDHWHALVTLEALRRGKDVYCEKPLTHRFAEGQCVVREAAQRAAVFQVGSQQRSMPIFRYAVDLVRRGRLGAIKRIEVGLPAGYAEPQGDATVVAPPESLDYEFWCGPAAKLPYMRARAHRWWRGHSAYGGGTIMDWIGHHNDVAHWSLGLDQSGPQTVEARGWTFAKTTVYDTPVHFEIDSQYSNGVAISIADRYPLGVKWIGESGWLYVTRGRIKASDPRWIERDFEHGPGEIAESVGHYANFLDCVRSRSSCAAPPAVALRSITPGFLGYVSHALGRPVHWNPEREEIVADGAAEKRLKSVEYRAPWIFSPASPSGAPHAAS